MLRRNSLETEVKQILARINEMLVPHLSVKKCQFELEVAGKVAVVACMECRVEEQERRRRATAADHPEKAARKERGRKPQKYLFNTPSFAMTMGLPQ